MPAQIDSSPAKDPSSQTHAQSPIQAKVFLKGKSYIFDVVFRGSEENSDPQCINQVLIAKIERYAKSILEAHLGSSENNDPNRLDASQLESIDTIDEKGIHLTSGITISHRGIKLGQKGAQILLENTEGTFDRKTNLTAYQQEILELRSLIFLDKLSSNIDITKFPLLQSKGDKTRKLLEAVERNDIDLAQEEFNSFCQKYADTRDKPEEEKETYSVNQESLKRVFSVFNNDFIDEKAKNDLDELWKVLAKEVNSLVAGPTGAAP